ncbi:hypothetical protein THRCLA_10253, partial [Thraustotheca clavata]
FRSVFEVGNGRRVKEEFNVDIPIKEIAVGSQVAARVARSHELWILASVIKVDSMTRLYEVEDEDSGDEETEGKRHHLVPRDWIVPLPREDQINEWISFKWNQKVLAMYPNTTSFYPAIVVIPNPPGSLYVVVKFEDDADELGYSPERKVPFRFVTPIKNIDELPWDHPSHMELGQNFVESLRDMLLAAYSNNFNHIQLDVYATLEALVLRLPTLSKDRMFKSVKSMLPGLRDTIVEALTALMYCMGTKFWNIQENFTKNLALKLADPLVFSDMLFVLRPATDSADTKNYNDVVDAVVNTLIKSLHQLPRYSKPLAKKILESVSCTAQGAGVFFNSHVETIGALLVEVKDECPSSLRSNFISALTRLYLISPFQSVETIESYCDVLSTAVLNLKTTALEDMLLLLQNGTTTIKWLLSAIPSEFWMSFLEMCTTSLSSFPVFEEDIPLVLAQLNICTLLVPHQSGMNDWNQTTLKPLLSRFITQMQEDEMIELAQAALALEFAIKA